jgi:hypothetical protein
VHDVHVCQVVERPKRPTQRGSVSRGAGDEVGDPGHDALHGVLLGPHLLAELEGSGEKERSSTGEEEKKSDESRTEASSGAAHRW